MTAGALLARSAALAEELAQSDACAAREIRRVMVVMARERYYLGGFKGYDDRATKEQLGHLARLMEVAR